MYVEEEMGISRTRWCVCDCDHMLLMALAARGALGQCSFEVGVFGEGVEKIGM